MDTWGTVIGQRTMDSINRMCDNVADLELRDLFAMNIMNGICANGENEMALRTDDGCESLATMSYKLADAMIKVRKNR